MDQLKAHYEKFLLIAGGVLLAGAALYLAGEHGSLAERFTTPDIVRRGAAFEHDKRIAQLKADRAMMDKQQAWDEAPGSLFVSREYIQQDGRLIDIMQGDAEIFPGIPNKWLKQHNLDYSDRKLPERDPDGDGYTNLEEFLAQTNPKDPASHPAAWTKVRLAAIKQEQLRIKFQTVTDSEGDDIKEVQINTISPGDTSARKGVTKFYKIGESIKISERGASGGTVETETPFKFVRAQMRGANGEPEIVLQNTADGREIRLEREKVKDSPYALVTLKDTRTGQEFQLRSGDDFELPEAGRYKLIDVTEEKAQIKDLRTEEICAIPREVAVPPLLQNE